MILDGRAYYRQVGVLFSQPEDTYADPAMVLRAIGYDPPPLDHVADDATPADAEVNHGLWIACCPWDHAPGKGDKTAGVGGGVVWNDHPYLWCPRCKNADIGGKWRPVRFPPERGEIERALARRTDPETRNWWPGETAADLERENALHPEGVA